MQTNLDLYTDYLFSSFGQKTATGLARLTDGAVVYYAGYGSTTIKEC